jgi:hypothetical protein
VVLGNLTGPTRALGAAVDVNSGATGIGANSALLGKLGNNLLGTTDTTSGSYTAAGMPPAPLLHLRVDLRHPLEERHCLRLPDLRWPERHRRLRGQRKQDLHGLPAANTTGYDVGLKYANGPAMAAVTYNAVSLGNAANTDVSDFRVGGATTSAWLPSVPVRPRSC